MFFEHQDEPLLPYHLWLQRVRRSAMLGVVIAGAALTIGILGYHEIGHLSWVDSLLEASMILGGMGAIAPMKTEAIKLFASAYALLSGLVIITCTGVIVAPWLHRLLHAHTHRRSKK